MGVDELFTKRKRDVIIRSSPSFRDLINEKKEEYKKNGRRVPSTAELTDEVAKEIKRRKKESNVDLSFF